MAGLAGKLEHLAGTPGCGGRRGPLGAGEGLPNT